MAVTVGPERDSDGQPTTLHVTYAAGHHVSEAEAEWLRDLAQRYRELQEKTGQAIVNAHILRGKR
jgi:hypothetical protein